MTSDTRYDPIFEPNEIPKPGVTIEDYTVQIVGALLFLIGIALLIVFALLYVKCNHQSKKEGL